MCLCVVVLFFLFLLNFCLLSFVNSFHKFYSIVSKGSIKSHSIYSVQYNNQMNYHINFFFLENNPLGTAYCPDPIRTHSSQPAALLTYQNFISGSSVNSSNFSLKLGSLFPESQFFFKIHPHFGRHILQQLPQKGLMKDKLFETSQV